MHSLLQHTAPPFHVKYDSYQLAHLFYGHVLILALIKSGLKDLR